MNEDISIIILFLVLAFVLGCWFLRFVLGTGAIINRLGTIRKHTTEQTKTHNSINVNIEKLIDEQQDVKILVSTMENHLRTISEQIGRLK